MSAPAWIWSSLFLVGCSFTLEPPCPPEMANITDIQGQVLYCIDRWELEIVGPGGEPTSLDVPNIDITTLSTRSRPGILPGGASFNQARILCHNTPVLNTHGDVVGHKHLATSSEWEDAGDGVPGPGGHSLPYGDVADPSRCITLDGNNARIWDAPQPTGSLPGCKSEAGVYDQIGNMWEWTDPQVDYDPQRWLKSVHSAGLKVDIDENGFIKVAEDQLSQFKVGLPGVLDPNPHLDEQGRLAVTSKGSFDHRGTLFLSRRPSRESMPDPRDFYLPVELPLDPTTRRPTSLTDVPLKLSEGTIPVVDKRGCAFYAGSPLGCTLHESAYNHRETFRGTIGFRCAAPPITR